MKSTLPNLVGKTLLLFLCSLSFTQSHSQHLMFGNEKIRVEAGFNFGPTFFLGDLGGNRGKGTTFVKDVNLELTKMMKGAFITVYPNEWMGLRAAAQYTYVSGEDDIINTKGVDELWRKQRNLDFKSNMWEVYGAVEIYPTMLFRKYDDYDPRLKPYGFIGVGMFHFNPKGSLTDANGKKTWHELQPLSTEGQGFAVYPDKQKYSLTQMNIPMGFGLKYALSEKINIGTELLYRKTFTDYIDDVSTTVIDPNYFDVYLNAENATVARKIYDKTIDILTPGVNRYPPGTQRGNPKNKDAYFSGVIKLGINLGTRNTENDRQARQTRCPHFY